MQHKMKWNEAALKSKRWNGSIFWSWIVEQRSPVPKPGFNSKPNKPGFISHHYNEYCRYLWHYLWYLVCINMNWNRGGVQLGQIISATVLFTARMWFSSPCKNLGYAGQHPAVLQWPLWGPRFMLHSRGQLKYKRRHPVQSHAVTFRCMMYHRIMTRSLLQVPKPTAPAGGLLLRVKALGGLTSCRWTRVLRELNCSCVVLFQACGVCRSDYHGWKGFDSDIVTQPALIYGKTIIWIKNTISRFLEGNLS